ncbi:MAG: hypothetical protein LBP52_00845, partial [Burkholderiaceae bacterium]|nr:hypothetical protein [Burkholderiaceae bacterium]
MAAALAKKRAARAGKTFNLYAAAQCRQIRPAFSGLLLRCLRLLACSGSVLLAAFNQVLGWQSPLASCQLVALLFF